MFQKSSCCDKKHLTNEYPVVYTKTPYKKVVNELRIKKVFNLGCKELKNCCMQLYLYFLNGI